MNRSLNIINKEFKVYAVADKRVNGYFWGDFIEAINSAEPAHYPLMLVTPQPGNVGEKFVTYSFVVSLFDKYEQGSQRQLQEVHSDMHRIGVDLIRVIKNSYRWNSYAEIQVTVNSNPFIERGQDFTAGWYFNVSLKVYENEDICEVPLTDYDLQAEGDFGATCDPATVRNSDDSFVELVASGGTYIVPDTPVTVTDQDGNPLGSDSLPSVTGGNIEVTIAPSGDGEAVLLDTDGNVLSTTPVPPETTVNIVAPDSSYLVEYENGTPIQSGTILSGGSETIQVPNPIVCENATAELYFDGELIDTLSIPSGDTDSFNIDCSTLLNAVRVESDEFSHQHTGTFVLIGEENGKPKYEKDGDPDRVIRYNGTRWILEKLGGGAHTHDAAIGNEDFPWLANWDDAFLLVSQATIGTYCANGAYAYYRLVDTDGNVLFTGSIPSGDTADIVAPDTDLEINGTPEGSFTAGSTIDLQLTDGVNPVTPVSVGRVGDTVTVEVAAGTPQAGRELMPTGQTTVFRTGDDADNRTVNGRAVSFTTLDYTNPFGNTNRFTDELGGTTYTNNWVIDWSTYNNVTGKVLGYYRVINTSNVNWETAIDDCRLNTFGTFSGCRLLNRMEMLNICLHEGATLNYPLNYAPFNISLATIFWTATTNATTTTQAFTLTNNAAATLGTSGKTGNGRYFPVRTFTVTGTTLT